MYYYKESHVFLTWKLSIILCWLSFENSIVLSLVEDIFHSRFFSFILFIYVSVTPVGLLEPGNGFLLRLKLDSLRNLIFNFPYNSNATSKKDVVRKLFKWREFSNTSKNVFLTGEMLN